MKKNESISLFNFDCLTSLKNPLSELALQAKGFCFMFRLASVCNQIGSYELIMN